MSSDTVRPESRDPADTPGPEDETPGFFDLRGLKTVDPIVFGVSFGVIALVCILGGFFTEQVGAIAEKALGWVTSSLGWLYILAASAFVVFALVLAFGRYGRIPLSRHGEPPEFRTASWVAMMFSAGMGIGLMFFGVYEPVSHLSSPPPFVDAEPGSQAAANAAMAYTLFHWGLHPWAMYAVVGLALAYSTYRMGRGNLLSAPFQAIFGKKRMEGGWGKPIDILAIICTKFGSAVSLGLGALQIAAGISLLRTGQFAEKPNTTLAIIVICVLTVGIVLSAASGVAKGIQILSNTNMIIAFLLVVFVFIAGPTVFMLDLFPAAIGDYLSGLVTMSFESAVFGGGDWLADWTVFYWAWWISWTPFVGTFIARISRGRTIREYVLGVLLVPTGISVIWFVVFGGAGIKLQMDKVADIASQPDEAAGFFAMLQHYPGYAVLAGVVMFLTAIFFVSGADAGAVVLSTLSSRGRREPWDPLVVLWAVMTGVVAGILLFVGGLDALKTFAILAATPFILVLIGLCVSLYVDLKRDPLRQRRVGPVRGHVPVQASAPFSDADLNGGTEEPGVVGNAPD